MSDRIRIGLLWHSARSPNLGVGALTHGNIALAERAAARCGLKPEFVVMAMDDSSERYPVGADIEESPINRRTMLARNGLGAAIDGVDCVLDIGGGDSFADIYGLKRFIFMTWSKRMVTGRRVPLLLSPQTIGPFDRPAYRFAAARVMRGAWAIVARDPTSHQLACKMAPGVRQLSAVDVAFALPYVRQRHSPASVRHIGLNISGLLFSGGYTGSNQFGLDIDYREFCIQLAKHFSSQPDVRLHLVPHVQGGAWERDDDLPAIKTLAAMLPDGVATPQFASPSEAKSYISGLDLLIGARMHACIAAFSSGVAVLPVSYSRKFSGLFGGTLGYDHGIPVKGMTTDQALAYAIGAAGRIDDLRRDVALGNARVEQALDAYVDLLAEFFAEAAGHRK